MILLNKKPGITPLAAITTFRKQYPSYEQTKLAYAGRLDPLAEGLLLILEGKETKERETFEKLEKIYSFSVLFGVATDSYDILGKITKSTSVLPVKSVLQKQLTLLLSTFRGEQMHKFPPYSAARVNGKPLFYWARQNLLDTIQIPEKKITLYDISCTSMTSIPKNMLHEEIIKRVKDVFGDFRQDEILSDWDQYFAHTQRKNYLIANCSVSCSSGTYVRSIANMIGERLQIATLAWTIKREQIGEYVISDALTLG